MRDDIAKLVLPNRRPARMGWAPHTWKLHVSGVGPPHPVEERHGSWSLLVEFCDYVVDCGRERFTHEDTDQALIGRCLATLDGRTLVEISDAHSPHALALRFDGGGSVLLMPSSDAQFGPETEQWLLRLPDGKNVGYSNGGVFDAA